MAIASFKTLIDCALEYVGNGFRVLPLKPGDKIPLTVHGLKDATQTQLGVKEYWTRWPDAGIGLVTEGLLVVDFDAGHGGLESKRLLETQYGLLPKTRTHRTGGGGEHWLYRATGIRNAVSIAGYQGVDIRGKGGYIVAPPSLHSSGNRYEVIDDSPIKDAPTWLIDLVTVKPTSLIQTETSDTDGGPDIPEGQRNNSLTSLAGSMRQKGMTKEAILAALKADNQLRCSPPLPDSEVEGIAISISQYPPGLNTSLISIKKEGVIGGDFLNVEPKPLQTINPVKNRYETLNGVQKSPLTSSDIKTYLAESGGQWVMIRDLDTDLDIRTSAEKNLRRQVIYQLTKAHDIDKDANFNNRIRWVNSVTEKITISRDCLTGYIPLRLPLQIEELVDLYPRNIGVIAGDQNAGKTAFLLNVARMNSHTLPTVYYTSEMAQQELVRRLLLFGDDLSQWDNIDFRERTHDFADVIRPDYLNIIDYIELAENLFLIGKILAQIYERLTTGIAFVGIQKKKGQDFGRGQEFGMEKPRLYISMNHDSMKIIKGKSWHTKENPNLKQVNYRIEHGHEFVQIGHWAKDGGA